MNAPDYESVIQTLAGLWPKAMAVQTPEQAKLWQRVLTPYDAARAIPAIRQFAERSRYIPHPSEIRDIIQANAAQHRGPAKPMSTQDGDRARWAKSDPANELVYRNMSDDEVDLQNLAWCFVRSVEVHGVDALTTIRAWQQWQGRLYAMGQRSSIVQTPHHTDAARQQYANDPTGRPHAAAIRDRHRRREVLEEVA